MTGMTGTPTYDPRQDVNAFYRSLADGSLGSADAGDVADLADRAEGASDKTLAYLGLGGAEAIPGIVRDQLMDAYYDEVASQACTEGMEAMGDGAAEDLRNRIDSVAARVCVPFETVAAAYDDPVSYDRIMETYYRS